MKLCLKSLDTDDIPELQDEASKSETNGQNITLKGSKNMISLEIQLLRIGLRDIID